MNANFDEKQAFENLRDILNHIYNFANYYYAEMKASQSACNDKNIQINNLKTQLANEREQAETRLKETIQAKDAELDAQRKKFENELDAQIETFNKELAKSREHNEKLTTLLQNFSSDLKTKEEELNEKEKTLNEKERQIKIASDTLVTASANLDDEHGDFYALKEIRETTPSDAERIRNLEKEAGDLTRQKKELDKQLADKEQKIEKLKADNKRLQIMVENANAECKGKDSAAKNTSESEFVADSDDDVNVKPIKAINFNDQPAENADTVTDSKKPDVTWLE